MVCHVMDIDAFGNVRFEGLDHGCRGKLMQLGTRIIMVSYVMHGEVDAVANGLKHGCSGKWVPSGIGSYSYLIVDWIRDGRLVGLGVDAPGHECGFGARMLSEIDVLGNGGVVMVWSWMFWEMDAVGNGRYQLGWPEEVLRAQ